MQTKYYLKICPLVTCGQSLMKLVFPLLLNKISVISFWIPPVVPMPQMRVFAWYPGLCHLFLGEQQHRQLTSWSHRNSLDVHLPRARHSAKHISLIILLTQALMKKSFIFTFSNLIELFTDSFLGPDFLSLILARITPYVTLEQVLTQLIQSQFVDKECSTLSSVRKVRETPHCNP